MNAKLLIWISIECEYGSRLLPYSQILYLQLNCNLNDKYYTDGWNNCSKLGTVVLWKIGTDMYTTYIPIRSLFLFGLKIAYGRQILNEKFYTEMRFVCG